MTKLFKALSDETRLRMLSLLWNGEMCVCEIEKCLNLTQSNASRHLTTLKDAGFLTSFKKAQWAYYKLNESFYENNTELMNYLSRSLKTLPTYNRDLEELKKYAGEDLCRENCERE